MKVTVKAPEKAAPKLKLPRVVKGINSGDLYLFCKNGRDVINLTCGEIHPFIQIDTGVEPVEGQVILEND